MEWLFDAEVAKKAEQYIFHPKQKMYKNKDGSLTVKFTAGGRVEMDWHLYTWGEHVNKPFVFPLSKVFLNGFCLKATPKIR